MERYGTCIVASPGGRSVGGCKSILDGGYSGPSSHISLDMNLCLRSTCLPAGRLLFPSLLLPRLLRPSSCRLPLRHLATLLRRTTSQQRAILRPPSPSCPTTLRRSSLFTAPPPLSLSLSFSRRYFHSSRNPLLPSTEDARGFSPSSVFLSPSPSSARIHSSGVSLLAIREYTECLHRFQALPLSVCPSLSDLLG